MAFRFPSISRNNPLYRFCISLTANQARQLVNMMSPELTATVAPESPEAMSQKWISLLSRGRINPNPRSPMRLDRRLYCQALINLSVGMGLGGQNVNIDTVRSIAIAMETNRLKSESAESSRLVVDCVHAVRQIEIHRKKLDSTEAGVVKEATARINGWQKFESERRKELQGKLQSEPAMRWLIVRDLNVHLECYNEAIKASSVRHLSGPLVGLTEWQEPEEAWVDGKEYIQQQLDCVRGI